MTQLAHTLMLVTEDSSTPETLPVTPELASVLAIATNAKRASPNPEKFDLAFSTILYGFLRGADPCCRFFQTYAATAGLDRAALLRRKQLTEETLAGLSDSVPTEPTGPVRSCTRSAKKLLDNAQAIRKATAPSRPPGDVDDPIDVRHLMGAYIYRPAGHGDELESLGLSRLRWSEAFRGWILGLYPEESSHWDVIDAETFQKTEAPSGADGKAHATGPGGGDRSSMSDDFTFDTDSVFERIPLDCDRMNMKSQVERFARLLTAREIHPPIALGLFGRWGSGKSFFMGLLRTRVDELKAAGLGSRYVANPVQVTFNAWHYQDTNLWASLALRIFEGIAEKMVGGKLSATQEKRRELHSRLSSSKRVLTEATTRRDDAATRRAEIAANLAAKKRERENKQNALSLGRLANVWQRLVHDDGQFNKEINNLKNDAEALGLHSSVGSIEDIQALQSRLKAFDSGTKALVSAAHASFRDVRTGALSCLCVAAVIALVLLIGSLGSGTGAPLSAFSTAFLQLAAFAGAAGTWATRRLQQVSRVAERSEKLCADVRGAWNASDATKEEEELADQLRKLDADIQKQSEQIAAAERSAAQAEAEIQRINEGGLVYDFLQERRASDRYLGQLGLISTIRQDFEQLRALLGELKTEGGSKPIDRIILYIDDLDRCQPRQVVQVLQAVHLLLYFDIFNVVVGVDGRWLERSLAAEYGGTGKDGSPDAQPSPFRAQNYLEKIFQIPYSLAAMNQDTFGTLVEDLLPTRSERDGASSGQGANAQGITQKKNGVTRNIDLTAANVQSVKTPERIDLQEAVGSLFFEDFEEEFLKKLYPFVSTPRLAKRLVNIYRLIRARAAAENRDSFVEESTGTYRVALLLLAVNIGAAQVAGKLLYCLSKDTQHSSLAAFLKDIQDQKKTPGFTDDERFTISRLAACIHALSADVPDDLKAYKEWASLIGSYTFDWDLAGDDMDRPRHVPAG